MHLQDVLYLYNNIVLSLPGPGHDVRSGGGLSMISGTLGADCT